MNYKNKIIVGTSADVYDNLALESALLSGKTKIAESRILFLWKSENAVVIGANQNAYAECDMAEINKCGVNIARRRTGGGAVYHSNGNLNFSFIMPKAEYSVPRQLDVIVSALSSFGIDARISGRNDITVCGKKISGNAFYNGNNIAMHHGTLLVSLTGEQINKFLKPDYEKLRKNSVQSVCSRVGKLSDYSSEISDNALIDALIYQFKQEYGEAEALSFDKVCDCEEWISEREIISSHDYIFGKWEDLHSSCSITFAWGRVAAEISNNGNKNIIFFTTDGLYPVAVERAEHMLNNNLAYNYQADLCEEENAALSDLVSFGSQFVAKA